jgi:hypothetical protein
MTANISPIPEIPTLLRIAAERQKLIPFIGAGASMLAKAPNWTKFADDILNELVIAKTLSDDELKIIQEKKLSPRVKLSIASGFTDKAIKLPYDKILHGSAGVDDPTGREVYGYIGKLSKTFVTTNYDRWLDQSFAEVSSEDGGPTSTASKRRIYYKRSELRIDAIGTEDAVFHIHGSLDDDASMIMSTRDYLEHYRNDYAKSGGEQNQLIVFLEHLFKEYHVLFIGYGLEEIEILEYVIQKSLRSHPTAPNHYILMPFHSREVALARLYDRYFREQCGVELLPYSLDDNGYLQLAHVLGHYANELRPIGSAESTAIEMLEAMLENA